ncbi:MAG: DUF3038 domain-containing protein [Microcystaceae cyanobacterium]
MKPSTIVPNWEDFPLETVPDDGQLDNIKTHLDLILMALEALGHLGSDAMIQTAKKLHLEEIVGDRISLWRLRQSNPLRKSSGGRKKLDVDEARSLVLIISTLAQDNQELIRRAVMLLEQATLQHQEPHKSPILGDYLDQFTTLYQERLDESQQRPVQDISRLALKLLIDLLFYSGNKGHRRLWLALLDYSYSA